MKMNSISLASYNEQDGTRVQLRGIKLPEKEAEALFTIFEQLDGGRILGLFLTKSSNLENPREYSSCPDLGSPVSVSALISELREVEDKHNFGVRNEGHDEAYWLEFKVIE